MSAIMNIVFRARDEVSPILRNIGSGGRVIAGLEENFVRVNSAMGGTSRTASQAAASLARLSGDTSGVVAASRQLVNVTQNEADAMHNAALSAQATADTSERLAAEARNHYNALMDEIRASDEVTDSMRENAQAALEEAERLEESARSARERADSMEQAADAMAEHARTVTETAEAEERLRSVSEETASAQHNTASAFEESERAAEEYGDALRNAAGESDRMSEAAQGAADESERLGSSGASAGELLQDAFGALGVAEALNKIKDAFVECASASIEFESAITGVYKTVDGTDEQLAEISNGIKEMALEIPSSTTEIAGVAEAAGQLGIATEDITDFTEVMINLGEATNLSADEAASSLAKFANITGMAASDYEKLGSTIVGLGNNFATTEADIVAMATRMASAGTLAGLTESDILGLAAAMSSVGIEAEAGGSAMSKLMADMQIAVETGNDSLIDFADAAGMTTEQFSDAFKNNAVNALYAFINGLNDVERNGRTATVILEDMGIKEIRLSNAVKSLANSSDGLIGSVRLAGEAWEENAALANETEKRYGTLESRLAITGNAANNLKVAIGDQLTPAIGVFSDMGTKALNWLTGIVENHPAVTAVITGFSVGLGVLAVSVGGVTLAVNVLIPAVARLGTVLNAHPVFAAITGFVTLASAVATAVAVMKSDEKAVEDYNGTLEQCRNEIDNTQKAYENVCKMYGENSKAAKQLADDLETLNVQYEKGGGFVEEYAQKAAETSEALNSFRNSFENKISDIDSSLQNGFIATAQLKALSEQSKLTNDDLDMMGQYADYLNDTFNCNIVVDYDTGKLTGFDPTSLNADMKEWAEENIRRTSMTELTSGTITNDYREAFRQLNEFEKISKSKIYEDLKAQGTVTSTADAADLVQEMLETDKQYAGTYQELVSNASGLRSELYNLFELSGMSAGDADEYIQSLNDDVIKLRYGIADLEDSTESLTDSAEEAKEAMTPDEAAADALSEMSDSLLTVAQRYDEAYEAAFESFQGQFGLFDEAQANAEATVESAQAALDSQLAYWEGYKSNIEYMRNVTAEELGVTQLEYEAFMEYVRTGTPEAVGLLNSMVGNIEEGNSEAVTNLIETNGEVTRLQEETASATADWTENLNQELQKLVDEAEEKIRELDMSDTAQQGAINTVNMYAHSIFRRKEYAVSAARNMVNEIQSELSRLNSINVSVPNVSVSGNSSGGSKSVSIDGNATGTPYANPGLALVGEEGPELVRFNGGEQVYPNDVTMSMIMKNPEMFPTYHAYEKGTLSAAPGIALVGEKGPELVVMNGGERVFTANETERIFSNNSEKAFSPLNISEFSNVLNYDNSTEYIADSSVETAKIFNSFNEKNISADSYLNNKSVLYSDRYGNAESVVNNQDYGKEISAVTFIIPKLPSTEKVYSKAENFLENHTEKSLPAESTENSLSMLSYGNSAEYFSNRISETEKLFNSLINPVTNISSSDSLSTFNRSDSYSNDYSNQTSSLMNRSPVYYSDRYSNLIQNSADSFSDSEYKNNSTDYFSMFNPVYRNNADSAYYENYYSNSAKNINDSFSELNSVFQSDNYSDKYLTDYSDKSTLVNNADFSKIEPKYKSNIADYYSEFNSEYRNNTDYFNELNSEYKNNSADSFSTFNSAYQPESYSELSISEKPLYISPGSSSSEKYTENSAEPSKRTIDLNIKGSGTVSVKSNISKEEIVAVLISNLKPVLTQIVEQEIFEEGEGYYET